MYQDFRIVVVTPAGRQRYLELLIPQVKTLKPVVDEYRLWVNTTNEQDIQFMEEQQKQDPEFITLDRSVPQDKIKGCYSIHKYFRNCHDPNTIYVRFDDDIVLLDTLDAFKAFLDFRIQNPQYFLVYGNILNNAIISHIHQRMGIQPIKFGRISGYACMDRTGWENSGFALTLHNTILDAMDKSGSCDLSSFRMPVPWKLYHNERVSINCIAWFGSTFKEHDMRVGLDEEQWLSVEAPRRLSTMNCICGSFVVVHFAFAPQRDELDRANILERYKEHIKTRIM